jgi:hypothetical protein
VLKKRAPRHFAGAFSKQRLTSRTDYRRADRKYGESLVFAHLADKNESQIRDPNLHKTVTINV